MKDFMAVVELLRVGCHLVKVVGYEYCEQPWTGFLWRRRALQRIAEGRERGRGSGMYGDYDER
jgi:hypothetical protein